jgi:hypothetical protein
MTTPELVAALGAHVGAIPDAERRVQVTLNYLARSRGIIAKEGKRGAALWSLALAGSEQQ